MFRVWERRAQMQRVPTEDKKEERRKGSTHGNAMKGTARRKAGIPCKGKRAGKGEEIEESRGRRSGMPHRGKSAARRVEEKLMGGFEEEGRVVL